MNMNRNLKLPLFLVTFATFLAGSLTLRAGTAGIHDNAGFFSEAAKSDAGRNITELQRSLKKDLCIETFAEIPADLKQGVNMQDKAAVSHVVGQWAVKRAREQGVNGVFVLLVKEPAHLQAVVGNETQKQAFTLGDRDTLVSQMLAKLRSKNADGALREGVSFVASTMRNHAMNHARPATTSSSAFPYNHSNARPESSFGWLVPLLIFGVIGWVVFGIVRSLFRGGMSGGGGMSAGGMMPGQTSGGFFQSLMGGMFGAAAGMWLYDQFSGSHNSAYGASPEDRPFGNDSGFNSQDTDYSSSGGSFGDDSSSGGGGFFGGDSGGGFGGGDSGGGGGDF